MAENHRRIFDQLDRMEGKLNQVVSCIHGNGQPGLKTVVAQHSQTLAVVKRVIWGIAAAFGTVATAYAMSLL